MWILKGIASGTILFAVGTFFYVLLKLILVARRLPGTGLTALDVRVLKSWTINEPWYWIAFVLVVVASCYLFASRRP